MLTFDSGRRTVGTLRRAPGLRCQPLFSPDDPGGVTPATPAAPATPTTPATPATPAADPSAISAADLEALRTELQSLKDADEARTQATLTEQQKLEQRATKAEQRAQQLQAERTIEQAAAALKLDAKLALRLLPVHTLEFDDKGQPKNIKAQLQQLATEFPMLNASASTSSTSTTNPPRQAGTGAQDLASALSAHYAK